MMMSGVEQDNTDPNPKQNSGCNGDNSSANKDKYGITLLFVDDEPAILRSVARLSRSRGWDATTVSSGAEGLEAMAACDFDVIVSDMRMPEMSGEVFLEKAREIQPHAVRIALSGYSDSESILYAINHSHVFKYLSKPWNNQDFEELIVSAAKQKHTEVKKQEIFDNEDQRSKTLGKVALLLDKKAREKDIEVEQAMSIIDTMNSQAQTRLLESLNVLNQIIEWREGRDAGHSQFVVKYAKKVADALEFNPDQRSDLITAATLHRVGLLCIPESLRETPLYGLDAEQRKIYFSYPVWGAKALKQASSLTRVAQIIKHQNEHVNGNGLPDGLTDTDIPIESKIIGVLADFYDAYNGRLEQHISGVEQAKDYIERWAGKRYDTKIAELVFTLITEIDDSCEKIISIPSEQLVEGMIIDKDVVSCSGVLLLSQGTQLNADNIEKIRDFEHKNTEQFWIQVLSNTCAPDQVENSADTKDTTQENLL